MKAVAGALVQFPTTKPARSRKRAPAAKRVPKTPGVIAQVRTAAKQENRLATMVGAVFGGFIPIATYFVAHQEVSYSAHGALMCALVLGGLVFSAKTVWQWGRMAFSDPWKATGFVLILEGVMTLSGLQWLGWSALALLVCVNAIATGVTLSRS